MLDLMQTAVVMGVAVAMSMFCFAHVFVGVFRLVRRVLVTVNLLRFMGVSMGVIIFCLMGYVHMVMNMRRPVRVSAAVHLLRLLPSVHLHGNMGAADAALLRLLTRHLHPWNPQCV